ncbi:MAG: hypothetical protein CMM28_08660 [Rhodospirillaceae bacterium]|nr:hypothetical protein [Rhodospirillaceae bacterium]
MATIHIVGAGIAGLSAAVSLAHVGHRIFLYESSTHAGGRCRSYHDTTLDCMIDNGNHLLLSGNTAVMDYLRIIGAENSLVGPREPAFHFFDVTTSERWCVKPNLGRFPWWIFSNKHRVPGSNAIDYLKAIKLAKATPDTLVTDVFDPHDSLFERYWEPLAVSVLNTPANEGAAQLLWPVLLETFGRGGKYSRPMIAKKGLSDSFVDPALTYLENAGAKIRFGARLRGILKSQDGFTLSVLNFSDGIVELGNNDSVIFALPAPVLGDIFKDISPPRLHYPIVNVHFRLGTPPTSIGTTKFMGIVGGTAEWLFIRGDVISVTVSAAKELAEKPASEISALTWLDISKALKLNESLPKLVRVVKEKRATFAQTPQSLQLRANTDTAIKNLKLAGDWTNTGLPATIEGAIRSGKSAAKAVLREFC